MHYERLLRVTRRRALTRYIPVFGGGYHSNRILLPDGQWKVLWHFRKKFTSWKRNIIYASILTGCRIHRVANKWDTKLIINSFNFQPIFKKNFIVTFSSKFAAKCLLNIPPHLICVATLPCETLISKNEWQLQTNVVINDKLQGTVVTYLRCGKIFNNQIKNYGWVHQWKNLKIGEYMA